MLRPRATFARNPHIAMSSLYPHLQGRRIVLASQSPRRRELIGLLGLDAECMARDVDESWPAELEGIEVAAFVATKKAEAYRDVLQPGDVLITGDTVVVLNGKVLEKPSDAAHACEMLWALSGQTHTVASAVAVTTLENGTQCALDVCDVTFNPLEESFIKSYVASGAPMDKAGAYGVQDVMGLIGVSALSGSFYTVMGMPTHQLHQLLLDLD
jgi:septum formation protein